MNEAFCDLCQSLFEGAVGQETGGNDNTPAVPEGTIRSQRHHEGVQELRDCARTRCRLCAVILDKISRGKLWKRFEKPGPEAPNKPPIRLRLVDYDVQLSIEIGPEDDRGQIRVVTLIAFDPLDTLDAEPLLSLPWRPQGECDSTSSEQSMQWAKEMLENCEAHHEKCKVAPKMTAPWLPTRLIFLGKPGHMPRLIETPGMLLEPCSAPPRYTTLSHCWGEAHPLKLTTQNRLQLSDGIPGHDIPKTFADAMEITRSLGLEYIWIDSLCIIQDDKRDWEYECTQMADVYRHGYCNIATLEAADSRAGCFYARDPTLLRPVVVEAKWHDRSRAVWVHRPYTDMFELSWEIDNSPVHLRAWVLQERLLSCRVLHFGQKMVYWECKEMLSTESGGVLLSPDVHFHGDARPISYYFSAVDHTKLSQQEAHDLVQVWCTGVVPRYTNAGLTFQTDKFIAISALARDVHRKLSSGTEMKVEYLAGHWSHSLEYQLLWFSTHPETATRLSQIEGVTAPSWSWASLNGPVGSPMFLLEDGTELVAHVSGHSVPPKCGDPFSGPEAQSRSVLQITGPCWKLLVFGWGCSYSAENPVVEITFSRDSTADSSITDADRFLLPIAIRLPNGRSSADYWEEYVGGLVLQKVDHAAETMSFQRIGLFTLCIQPQAVPEVDGNGWQAFLDKVIRLYVEHRIIWPSQIDRPSVQDATEITSDISEKAAICQTIFLE
ncbi:heterokaryon incompatibility protein-domain-containing protein [Achaetomium macrosporum]|uniref:Heterokaryon incompatibility protein-domain-containing protein n=1 Tax=Achaetomium macrosporum TaxID=79813 RepID=A0AAN7C0Y4_9PEZI|nr:heterokaryon incompatibility protein-domain-containing protein [Achaetomium macrosporum]